MRWHFVSMASILPPGYFSPGDGRGSMFPQKHQYLPPNITLYFTTQIIIISCNLSLSEQWWWQSHRLFVCLGCVMPVHMLTFHLWNLRMDLNLVACKEGSLSMAACYCVLWPKEFMYVCHWSIQKPKNKNWCKWYITVQFISHKEHTPSSLQRLTS